MNYWLDTILNKILFYSVHISIYLLSFWKQVISHHSVEKYGYCVIGWRAEGDDNGFEMTWTKVKWQAHLELSSCLIFNMILLNTNELKNKSWLYWCIMIKCNKTYSMTSRIQKWISNGGGTVSQFECLYFLKKMEMSRNLKFHEML